MKGYGDQVTGFELSFSRLTPLPTATYGVYDHWHHAADIDLAEDLGVVAIEVFRS